MKILHTSDWHIGKELMKIDFSEDLNLFFAWLLDCIKQENIDVLLMSGDLFDLANPSQKSLSIYYDFLKNMLKTNPDCKIIITGGNHDSATLLDAPKEILGMLDISVVGGITENISDLFIEIEKNQEKLVVAAVPFLRDKDIRKSAPGESYEEKTQQIKEGLAAFFTEINHHYEENFDGIPYLLMAHLFAQGASTSDSEREIQIGNQAGIKSEIFGSKPHYVALGHIHKPQKAGAENIRYSGSPIPFSFSEKNDQKQVIILNLNENKLQISPKEIPNFRKLKSFTGKLEEVKSKLLNYESDSILTDLAEINIQEENHNNAQIEELIALRGQVFNEKIKVIKAKIEFDNDIKGTASFLKTGDDIGNYSPLEMFKKRLNQDESLANDEDLINAFNLLLDEVYNNTER
jgi:DNA repair protein SbcD/Mre11